MMTLLLTWWACSFTLLAVMLWLTRPREAGVTERRIREAENGAFLAGYHAGIRDGVRHWASISGLPIHGFAQSCEHCGTHNALCQDHRLEYWNCRKCKRRNPSPLAPTEELYARKGGGE